MPPAGAAESASRFSRGTSRVAAAKGVAFSEMDSQEVEMGRVQGGRARVFARQVAVLALIFAFAALSGCAKKKAGGEDVYEGGNAPGMGESDMAHGSLEQYRKGSLGRDEQGPLEDVHFSYDSIELTDSAREILRTNADWLREHPKAKVEIEGHCDSRGTIEYNLALGAKRANAVRDYLTSLGVAGDRITTISYGKELQLCQEETETCWAENRRAHFVVLNQ